MIREFIFFGPPVEPLMLGRLFGGDWLDLQAGTPVRGEYASAWFDGRKVRAVRDPLGVVPLYYASLPDRIVFATTLREIAQQLSGGLTPDLTYLQGLWWEHYGLIDQSPFSQIRRLPPGHMLEADANSVTVRPWFQIQPPGPCADDGVALAGVRGAVNDAILRRMRTEPKIGLLLSGGYDSTLIAQRAAALAPASASSLHTYSLIFPDDRPSYNPDLPRLLERADWRAKTLEFRGDDPVYLDDDQSLYFYTPNLNLFAPLLRSARADGVRTVMTGLGGDDLFTHPPVLMAGLLRSRDWSTWLSLLAHKPSGLSWRAVLRGSVGPFLPESIFSRLSRGQLARGGFAVAEQERREIADAIRMYQRRRRRTHPWPHVTNILAKFFSSGMAAFAFEQEQELAQAHGLLMTYPLLDLDVIYAAVAAPVRLHAENYRNKGLLRAAMAPDLSTHANQIYSLQSYGEEMEALWSRQIATFNARRHWLGLRGLLDHRSGRKLSVAEVAVVNYAYKIVNTSEGALHEQNIHQQKDLPKADAETLWFG